MHLLNNTLTRAFCRGVFLVSNRSYVLGREHLPRRGPFLIACTHLSHYDPFCVSVVTGRRIEWMARVESFQTPLSEWLTRNAGGFAIDRFGCAVPGIREALRRLDDERIVGIFPEGEVMDTETSALTRGELKAGVGLLARRADVPVVPCVSLNGNQFRRVVPWLPLKAGRVFMAFGEPLLPDPELPHGRRSRWELTERLHVSLRELHARLEEAFDLPEGTIPEPPPAAAAGGLARASR